MTEHRKTVATKDLKMGDFITCDRPGWAIFRVDRADEPRLTCLSPGKDGCWNTNATVNAGNYPAGTYYLLTDKEKAYVILTGKAPPKKRAPKKPQSPP